MGSYLRSSTTGPRRPRRLATSAIGVVAMIGLVTACTASSVGAARRAPDRYPAGAALRAPAQVSTSDDTLQSQRLEQKLRRSLSATVTASTGQGEYELMRSEHQLSRIAK